MATAETKCCSAVKFWEFTQRPENRGKYFELYRGEIIEMPPPGEKHGILCSYISSLLWQYMKKRGSGGVSSNDTGLLVEEDPDTVRSPDLMVFAESKPIDEMSDQYPKRIPKLIIEVFPPTVRANALLERIGQYFQRGVPLVWVIYPQDHSVSVHSLGKEPRVLKGDDEVFAGEVLPKCRFRVAEFFDLPGIKKQHQRERQRGTLTPCASEAK